MLDVKLRADQVRATRLRWTAIGVVMLDDHAGGFLSPLARGRAGRLIIPSMKTPHLAVEQRRGADGRRDSPRTPCGRWSA